uniref:Retrotransposon, putative, centromere-specific n=2 Tax=Oryza sativa subsp. japonica TaxID=39947 RepID=Q53J77_ORYSJ|nr:retrotransposon protein, putative, Ty3-gypsy sub-class [Oryza sativa Japonica Group]ABA92981.1 retrotransposon, putative, centromere-specific [Oryza sativa Japonica Group]
MATTDTTIVHIMDEQEDIKIKSSRNRVALHRQDQQPTESYHNSPKDRANNSLECREELRVHQVVSELSLLGLRKGITDHRLVHLRQQMAGDPHGAYKVHDNDLARVESNLPVFDGKYDSAAYVNWELAVDKQFDEYDFSNAQMIKAASNKCTGSASFLWHTVGNKLDTWDEYKILMRKRFVFSYYRRALFEKFEHLKQGDKTVREYFHDFKICITYSGLQESNENTMTRFFRGLNSNIQAGLVNVTYNHIGQLFMLACNVERKILENPMEQQAMLVPPITDILQEVQNSPQNEKNDMFEMSLPSLANEEKADAPTLSEEGIKGKLNGAEITQGEYASDELHFSTFHTREEQPLVEPIAEMPLSQVDLLAVPCDRVELCDNASLISMPQLVNEHAISSISLCADFKHVVHIANEVVLNRPRDEHHMEKPRTVFREEREDDVTMATTDTTIVHIMDEQEDIKE